MANNKTSKEERERIINDALNEVENVSEENDTSVEQDINEVLEPQDEEESQTEDDFEAHKTQAEPENKQDKPDLETRYKESTKEAQVLYAKQKKFAETVDQATQISEPSEVELKATYASWDDMTETEKMLAKDNLINRKKFDLVYKAAQEGKEIDAWVGKVDSFITTEGTKFSKLAGREDDFRNFALKPTRRGIEPSELVKIFLYDVEDAPKVQKKGSLLQTGTGGNAVKPKKQYLNEKQAEYLRKNDHKKYQEAIQKGLIKIDLD